METEKNTLLYTYTNYYKDRLFTLHDILSPYESINLIDTANYKGWNESSPSGEDMVEPEMNYREQINFVFYIIVT